MTDNAAFLEFFRNDFNRMLDSVQIPGLPNASWDRKAAYLLWCSIKPPMIEQRNEILDLTATTVLEPIKLPWEK